MIDSQPAWQTVVYVNKDGTYVVKTLKWWCMHYARPTKSCWNCQGEQSPPIPAEEFFEFGKTLKYKAPQILRNNTTRIS